jgi:hypothetical protein
MKVPETPEPVLPFDVSSTDNLQARLPACSEAAAAVAGVTAAATWAARPAADASSAGSVCNGGAAGGGLDSGLDGPVKGMALQQLDLPWDTAEPRLQTNRDIDNLDLGDRLPSSGNSFILADSLVH